MRRERQKALIRQGIESIAFFLVALWLFSSGLENLRPKTTESSSVGAREPANLAEATKVRTKRKNFSRIRSEVVELGCVGKSPNSVTVSGDLVRFRWKDCSQQGVEVSKIEWIEGSNSARQLLVFNHFETQSLSTEFFRMGSSPNAMTIHWENSKGSPSRQVIQISQK